MLCDWILAQKPESWSGSTEPTTKVPLAFLLYGDCWYRVQEKLVEKSSYNVIMTTLLHFCKCLIFKHNTKYSLISRTYVSQKQIEMLGFFGTADVRLSEENDSRFWGRMLNFSTISAVLSNRLSWSRFLLWCAKKTGFISLLRVP